MPEQKQNSSNDMGGPAPEDVPVICSSRMVGEKPQKDNEQPVKPQDREEQKVKELEAMFSTPQFKSCTYDKYQQKQPENNCRSKKDIFYI